MAREAGGSLDEALTHEWLVTDGRGGYASGTIAGPHTRRYHGLLVAPLAPPLGRHVLLSKLEETLVLGGTEYELGANEFEDGSVHPRGFEYLTEFHLADGRPVWRYVCGDALLERRVWMEVGPTVVHASYRLEGAAGQTGTLRLVPLCAFRDFHHETVGSDDWRFRVEQVEGGLRVRAYAGATPYYLSVAPPAGRGWTWGGHQGWWWHFLHREERARGLDYLDDCFAVGQIEVELGVGETVVVSASLEPLPVVVARAGTSSAGGPLATYTGANTGTEEGAREGPQVAGRPHPHPVPDGQGMDDAGFVTQLRRAAEQFIVTRPVPGEAEGRTVLAGYHWFGDWGRDTFIALPGLAMATGRYDECRAIVRSFARYVDKGMLPNRFPDSGAPLNDGDYNTIDASLWYFHAVDVLDRLSGGGLVAEVFPTLVEIVDWHVRGTRFGIVVDPVDGLVRTGNPQLTWMDAKVGDWICTPRDGKPVEIAALWHHALGLIDEWARRLGRPTAEAERYAALRSRAADSFGERFWNAEGGCLFDTIDGTRGADPSFRPNQIIAAALPDAPLTSRQRQAVVDEVVARLWTPRGLRTLDPGNPAYRGRYEGDVWARDGAYHQGTVWPWLLGPLVDAHLLVYGSKVRARQLVEPLRAHLIDEACAGSVSEVFDGDAPHAPRGCIAQAWSVAEVYRAWMSTQ